MKNDVWASSWEKNVFVYFISFIIICQVTQMLILVLVFALFSSRSDAPHISVDRRASSTPKPNRAAAAEENPSLIYSHTSSYLADERRNQSDALNELPCSPVSADRRRTPQRRTHAASVRIASVVCESQDHPNACKVCFVSLYRTLSVLVLVSTSPEENEEPDPPVGMHM